MKKRGFTLVELLGVIVLLAAISLVTMPAILNQINNAQNKIDSSTQSIIINAAKLYVDDNLNDFEKNTTKTYCLTLINLIKDDYLDEGIVNANLESNQDKISETKTVKVTYTTEFVYEIVNNNACSAS